MGAALAVAAVTAALRHRLDRGLNAVAPGVKVTTRPPDKARDAGGGNQVNLFLFQTLPNAAWRNLPPAGPRPGPAAPPPLALNLYYLLSVYGQNDDDPDPASHLLLGEAMRLLHARPVLGPDELHDAAPGGPPGVAEGVRLTPQPLSVDELAKLWSAFQAPYRLSVAYEASVVLIEAGGA
jgi:hypothetical protein